MKDIQEKEDHKNLQEFHIKTIILSKKNIFFALEKYFKWEISIYFMVISLIFNRMDVVSEEQCYIILSIALMGW